MLQRFQDRVGTAGLIVAVVALVLALGGGAYAASGGLTGKQKKEVTKIAQTEARKYAKAGPTGPEGKQGAAGAAGARGDTGAKGDSGAAGTAGSNGTSGTNGTSVEVIPVPTGQTECAGNGGAILEPETIEICNGSPWTVGTLPTGKTEKGMWTITPESTETTEPFVAISFTVPLAGSAVVTTHFINESEEEEEGGTTHPKPAACPGTFVNPTALPGAFCVYEQAQTGVTFITGAPRPMGSILGFVVEPKGFASGSWAVTAP